jgi:hypothetical protein
MEFSRCSGPEAPKRKPPRRTVSQNSAAYVDHPVPGFSLAPAIYYLEVDVILGDLVVRTSSLTWNDNINEPGATGVIAPESLERR